MRWTYSFLLSGACCCGGKLPVSDEFVLSLEKLTTIFFGCIEGIKQVAYTKVANVCAIWKGVLLQ